MCDDSFFQRVVGAAGEPAASDASLRGTRVIF